MEATSKAPRASPRLRPILTFVFRALQIIFCLICLACAAHWAHVWAPYKFGTFQVFLILQSVNFAIFISVTGILLSSFLLFAPRIAPRLADDLPGLVDMILSGIWAIFFLSMGASLASWGKCKSNALCGAWNAVIGLGFFLFVLYLASAVLAALDLRDQLHALREQATPAAPAAPAKVKAATEQPRPATPTAEAV